MKDETTQEQLDDLKQLSKEARVPRRVRDRQDDGRGRHSHPRLERKIAYRIENAGPGSFVLNRTRT
jgi:hypothetical protein